MENKWEYDYSGLYQNGYNPAPGAPSGQMPGDGGMPGPVSGGEPPRKKRGAGKKVLAGALAAMLLATTLAPTALAAGGGTAISVTAETPAPTEEPTGPARQLLF